MKEGVASTRKDLEFVKRTVMAVESGRARFAHVDDTELGARKDFVKARERELDELAAVVSGPEATEKKAADRELTERKRREREVASGVSAESAYARAHDASIAEHRAQQQELMRKQDEDLSAIEGSVVRLGEMAKVINVELGDQERMLDDLDKEVDVAQSNLDRAIGAIQKLLKSKGALRRDRRGSRAGLWLAVRFLLDAFFVPLSLSDLPPRRQLPADHHRRAHYRAPRGRRGGVHVSERGGGSRWSE